MGSALHKAKLATRYYTNVIQGRPVSVNLEVTKRCNAKCDFCDYWKTKQENVLDDYGPVIEKISPMMVTITGGEPMLRPDLNRILERIKEVRPATYIAMITNGSLLTLDKAKALNASGLDQISLSVDFIDDRHDDSRGVPGLWKTLEKIIPQLPSAGFDAVNMNWIIMEENFDQIMDVAKLAHEWGVNVTYTSYSDLKNMNEGHFLSEDKLKALPGIIEELIQYKHVYKSVRSSDYYLSKIPEFYNHREIGDCPAGKRWVQITPEGWLKACSEMPPHVFWKDYDHKTSFSKQDCTLCWYGCRGENQTPINLQRIREFL